MVFASVDIMPKGRLSIEKCESFATSIHDESGIFLSYFVYELDLYWIIRLSMCLFAIPRRDDAVSSRAQESD